MISIFSNRFTSTIWSGAWRLGGLHGEEELGDRDRGASREPLRRTHAPRGDRTGAEDDGLEDHGRLRGQRIPGRGEGSAGGQRAPVVEKEPGDPAVAETEGSD